MDEATQDTLDLQQRLAALLEEIETTTQNLVGRIDDDSPGLSYADLLEPQTEPEDGADAPGADEAPEPTEDEADVAEQQVPMEEVDASDALDDAVEQMLQQAVNAAGGSTPEHAKALDDELARLGDELLARGDDAPEGTVQAPVEESVETPDEQDHSGPDELLALEPEPIDEALTETPPAPASETIDEDAEPVQEDPEPESLEQDASAAELAEAVELPEEATPVEPVTPAPAPRHRARVVSGLRAVAAMVVRQAPIWWKGAQPRVIHAMAVMSRPIADRSPMVRSAIGWIAIGTAFWGAVVLTYVLLIRDTSPPPAPNPVTLTEQPAD